MEKLIYEAPMVQVLEMELQGVIAISGGDDVKKQDWDPTN